MEMSRRDALLSGTALAALPGVAALAARDPHPKWLSDWHATTAELATAPDQPEEAADRIYATLCAIEDKIIDTPASSLDGAIAKLRWWCEDQRKFVHDPHPMDVPEAFSRDVQAVVSALRDLERMFGGAA